MEISRALPYRHSDHDTRQARLQPFGGGRVPSRNWQMRAPAAARPAFKKSRIRRLDREYIVPIAFGKISSPSTVLFQSSNSPRRESGIGRVAGFLVLGSRWAAGVGTFIHTQTDRA
jgi:hypothetical protein